MIDYAAQQRNPMKHIIGITVVVLLHVVLIYALINGLGAKIVQELHPPIKTKIITEPKPPPPPPPPPPPVMTSPPPPYIPPPRIQIQPPPQQHVIQQVTHTPPPKAMPPAVAATPTPAPPGPVVPDHLAGARPVNNVKLNYPEEMLEENREGRVTVVCDVEPSGQTSNCAVTSVQGGQSFAAAALEYVEKARYQPAVKNGVPIKEFHHPYTITFKLSDD